MFEAKPLADPAVRQFTLRSEPQALVQGEEVVALVFEERYAQLLSQAPAMLELIERVADEPCETGEQNECNCCSCAARAVLSTLPLPPSLH